jgi:hypothetical protein
MKTRTEPRQCSRDWIHARHTWSEEDPKHDDHGEHFRCPGLREHDFKGFPLICTRVGCGIHEEGLLDRDKFCKACPNCGSDEAVVCELCRPGQMAAIKAAWRDEFEQNINLETTRTKQAFAEAQRGHPGNILNLGRPRRTQIHVTHNNEAQTYHPVPDGEGWRIDAGRGTLIIGKGLGRVEVPLCNVLYFSPEEIG